MRQAVQNTKLMQAIIVALIAGGVIFWIGAEMGKPEGREDLKVEVVDIRSKVSEAAKIIEAAAAGRLTAKYFQNETAMLQEKLKRLVSAFQVDRKSLRAVGNRRVGARKTAPRVCARPLDYARDKINNRSAITYRLHRKKKTRIIKKKRTETRSFFSSHYRHSQ